MEHESSETGDLRLRYAHSREDLGHSLRLLRRRYAWQRHISEPSYRDLAEQTGYSYSTISEYFNGKVLPASDRLYAIVTLLDADDAERLSFAELRDALDERRRLGRDGADPDDDRDGHAGYGGHDGHRDVSPEVATSRLLRELLDLEPYRATWKELVRPPTGQVEAIALFIGRYLAATDEAVQEPDVFRRRIARALERDRRATVLSSTTLAWFIEAFDMHYDDARQLRHLHAGSPAIRYVRGVAGETRLPLLQASTSPYRTVDLREYHYLGPDGRPRKHRTDRIIRAEADGFQKYTYVVDTAAMTVEVEAGATPGPLYQIRAKNGTVYHATDIVLDAPLSRDETAVLNYTTTLRYTQPPPPEMRYAFRSPVDKFLLSVQFDAARVPRRLWWAEWDDLDGGEITHREPVPLTASLRAHRFLDGGAQRSILGFTWEW